MSLALPYSVAIVSYNGIGGRLQYNMTNTGRLYTWGIKWANGNTEEGDEQGKYMFSDWMRKEGFKFI